MKASLTLRENPNNPLVKAKIPLSILGIPLRSGIEAGDYKELCISFSTAFGSGPLLKFCYRPNDSCSPFGLTLRTGVGQFGSPTGSPISMSVEFGSIGNSSRPSFLLHVRPRSGDLTFRKSIQNPLINLSSQSSESLMIQNGGVSREKLTWKQLFSSAYGVLSDGEVCARTSVPVFSTSMVKLGWSMRFPPPQAAVGGGRCDSSLPYLMLRKIAIEHVAGDKTGKGKKRDSPVEGGDVAEACLDLKRELDLLKSEIQLLKKERMDDLKLEKVFVGRNLEFEANSGGGKEENNSISRKERKNLK